MGVCEEDAGQQVIACAGAEARLSKFTNHQLCDREQTLLCDSIHPSVRWDTLQSILHEGVVRIQLLNPLV